MTAPDLTPAEARAEIEAFLGPEWELFVYGPCSADPKMLVRAWRGGLSLSGYADTFRAAVAALKQAWRDAVRPWVRSAYSCGWSAANGGCDRDQIERDMPRVLKEDS